MRNIDRFRAMSLEELAPYFVHRTVINAATVRSRKRKQKKKLP